MTYKYKVIRETEIRNLATTFNYFGEAGWRVISVVWDYDLSCFVVTLEKSN